MREIKFKVWDKEQKRWWTAPELKELGFVELINNVLVLANENSDNTVVQNIGLRDKNGVEIFEGDIVVWEGEYGWHEVKWYPENCCFGISGLMQISKNQATKFEVVDNIFEQKQIRELR